MFTIMKRKYSDEEYRKILLKLLGDLNKIKADNGIKMIVSIEISTIPEQPKISRDSKSKRMHQDLQMLVQLNNL